MAAQGRRTVKLDGKGDSLSSATVFKDRIVIDSSFFTHRSSTNNSAAEFMFSIPEYFKPEVARASVILMLNKFLRSAASSSFYACAVQLVGILEQDHLRSEYTLTDVASDDLAALDYSAAATAGLYALFDHRSSALLSIANGVAALSCEALRANVSFSGDGLSKDINCVAADFKVLLKDSKLVNSGEVNSSCSVAKIAEVHGTFREISRTLHSKTRLVLDSELGRGSDDDMMSTALLPLVFSLSKLGCKSLDRTELISRSLPDLRLPFCLSDKRSELASRRSEILEDKCLQLLPEADDYLVFLHKIYDFLESVMYIVCWEAIVAFVSLQESDVAENSEKKKKKKLVSLQESDAASEKKKKKKKVVLLKGTAALMQFFKDRLLCGAAKFDSEKLAQDFQSLLDPKGLEFDDVITKVKEIVESNEKHLKLPKGTRDFAGKQKASRDKAFATILKVFKRHGGTGLDTPVFELRETLMDNYGEDSKKLIYDLADQGGELCSLRYDHTVPFARYIAMNGLSKFRRYQIAPVYRRDNISKDKGRYREFYQCDFDIAGNFAKMEADCEIICMLTELLDELGIGDYEVKINHKMLLDGMLAICGVPKEKLKPICSSIDKLDKMDFEQVKSEMVKDKGLAEETAEKIGKFVERKGPAMELLSQLKQEGGELLSNNEAVAALNELEILFGFLLKSKSNCMKRIVLDMSLARGLDYYTGLIFEVVDKVLDSKVGSIAGGGRYDKMIGEIGTKQVPSIGLSLGFERLFLIMEQLQQETNQCVRATETQVLVGILGDNSALAIEIVSELWDTKLINAEFETSKRMDKLINHAMESQIPYMAFVGDDELSRGVVKLKNMKNMTWRDVPRSQLVPELLGELNLV